MCEGVHKHEAPIVERVRHNNHVGIPFAVWNILFLGLIHREAETRRQMPEILLGVRPVRLHEHLPHLVAAAHHVCVEHDVRPLRVTLASSEHFVDLPFGDQVLLGADQLVEQLECVWHDVSPLVGGSIRHTSKMQDEFTNQI